ncbi:hypothetical protein D3C73_1076670 [compost metagenome]
MTSGNSASLSSKLSWLAMARSINSCSAEKPRAWERSGTAKGGGQSSGSRRWTNSPSARRLSRLVARMCTCGAPPSRLSQSSATLSIRCSQLSMTSSICRSRRNVASVLSGSLSCRDNPSNVARWPVINEASLIGVRSSRRMPSR